MWRSSRYNIQSCWDWRKTGGTVIILGKHLAQVQRERQVHVITFVWVICVLRHMQRYVSHICDGTDMQADWRRSCTYGRAPIAIEISQGSLTYPSLTDTGPTFLYGDSDTPPHLVTFYDTLGIRTTHSRLKPRRPHGGMLCAAPERKCRIMTETTDHLRPAVQPCRKSKVELVV